MVSMFLGGATQARCRECSQLGFKVIGDVFMHLRLDLSSVSGSPLSGQVSQRAMARSLELTVRHGDSLEYLSRIVVVEEVIEG